MKTPPDGKHTRLSTGAPWSTLRTLVAVRVSHSLTVWSYEPVRIMCAEAGLPIPARIKSCQNKGEHLYFNGKCAPLPLDDDKNASILFVISMKLNINL